MWEYEHDGAVDETTIYWTNGDTEVSKTISGEITGWRDGYPDGAGRDAVRSLIQSADTPKRAAMLFDLNYGFSERTDDTEYASLSSFTATHKK